MSAEFSKKKGKRSRSSTEDNNSFVKNVTSTVSSFLPASISKWLTPTKAKANGSTPAADATDSSTEDEAPESPVIVIPPAKRMRFTTPEFNHFNPTEITCVNTNIDNAEPKYTANSTPEIPSSKLFFHSNVGLTPVLKRKSIFQSPLYKNPPKAATEKSTKKEMMYQTPPSIFKPTLLCSPFYPGQTMYGGASSTHINQANIKQRKVALVNESTSSDNSSMSHSARRVMELLENASTPIMEAKRISQYINAANRNRNLSPEKEHPSTSSNTTSYKFKELNVPSVASLMQLKQRSRLMDTTNAARQIIASHSSTSPYQPRSIETPREQTSDAPREKYVTKIKNKINGPRQPSKMPELTYNAPLNLPTGVLQIGKDNMPKFTFTGIESNIPPVSTSSNNPSVISSSVIKVNSQQRTVNKQNEIGVKQPMFGTNTSIGLEPNDSSATKSVLMSHESSKPMLIETTLLKPDNSKSETVTTRNDSYKFSSPVRISNESSLKTAPSTFTFGSPERSVDRQKDEIKENNSSVFKVKTIENVSDPQTKDWRCSDCWVTNKEDAGKCVCCGAAQPVKTIVKTSKCSICILADSQTGKDKCLTCEKKNTLSNSNSNKWKCQDCWVMNDQNVGKCACCGANNPLESTKPQNSLSGSDSDWKCNECWIKNKRDVNVCAACGQSKPSNESTTTISNNSFGNFKSINNDNSLKNIVKVQSEKWECQSCLVRNENNISKCVCCGSEKPDTKNESSKASNTSKVSKDWDCPICLVKNESNRSKCVCCECENPGMIKESAKTCFNFSTTPNKTFKFGIDPKVQDAEVPKKVDVTETNNNVLPKTPTFTFGIPSKKDEVQTNTTKEVKTIEPPKMNFSFGIPKTLPVTEPAVVNIFGSANQLSDTVPKSLPDEEKEKLQEVPKVDITSTPKLTFKPLPTAFGSIINTSTDQSTEATITRLGPATTTVNLDTVPNSLTAKTVVNTSVVTTPQNMFSFASSDLKPAMNLFPTTTATTSPFSTSAPTPATATSTLFLKKPESSTTLFQKPETMTSSVSLFQKTESTTIAAPPTAAAATAPVFSFGTNGVQNTAPQPEKPKFNFTFGGMNTTFTNTFNSSADTSANKFDLTGGNLGANSGGLATGGAIPGNGLTVNKLGSNDLSTPGTDPQANSSLFAAPAAKDSLWMSGTANSTNSFATTNSSSITKPAAFTFGNSMTFNSNNTPAFGNNQAPAQNVFGMNQNSNNLGINQNSNNQSSMFSSPTLNQSTPSLFGNPQPSNNPAPPAGLFGNTNQPSGFAAPRLNFEPPAIAPSQPTAFNFNAPQPNSVFGMSAQQPQPTPPGVYNFSVPGGAPQFNIGSAPNTSVRRVRKAVRRNTPR